MNTCTNTLIFKVLLGGVALCIGVAGTLFLFAPRTGTQEVHLETVHVPTSSAVLSTTTLAPTTTTTAKPRPIVKVSPTTSELPPRLTAKQESTIAQGMAEGPYLPCPDVCEPIG